MRVPYIENEVLWCTTVAQMEPEQILWHMQGHNVFLIRTSESQIHHTGVMPHAWWENPSATLAPGYESHWIPEIMEEAQAFFPTLSVCIFPSHQIFPHWSFRMGPRPCHSCSMYHACWEIASSTWLVDVMWCWMKWSRRWEATWSDAGGWAAANLVQWFPQVREQLGETWDQLVRDDMK